MRDIMVSMMETFIAQIVVRNLDDDVKAKPQQRPRRHDRSTEEEVRDILRNAVKSEGSDLQPLGTRLKARFGGIGLDQEISELHGQPARPADLAS